MYSLWNSGFDFQFEKENTDNIIFDNFSNVIKKTDEWTIQDVYDWIISLNMNRSILIANCFKEEDVDGEALLIIDHDDVSNLFREKNLGRIGLFWLAIFKLQN
tara:strand:+ start:367 stop:675 length:309 start_codon:yes stop_codon:yes gene_type:complete